MNKDKGILKRLSIIYALVLVVLLVLLLITGIAMGDSMFNNSNLKVIDIEESYSIDGIARIEVESNDTNIKILSNDINEISIRIAGESKSDFIIDKSNTSLRIREDSKWIHVFSWDFFNKEKPIIELSLPNGYNELLKVNSVNGLVEIDGTNLKSIKCSTVSGDIYMANINTEDLELKVTSGRMELDNIVTERLSLDAISGDTSISNIETSEVEIDKVSGDVKIKFLNKPKIIDISSISGDSELDLPDDSLMRINLKMVSGKLKNHLENSTGDEIIINCSSVSGDLTIY